MQIQAKKILSVIWPAMALMMLPAGRAFADFTINNATVTFSNRAEFRTSTITINAGGVLSGGNSKISLSGNWKNSGAFNAGTSTVAFENGASSSAITGNTTFYSFVCEAAGKTIYFAAGSTQAVANVFTLTGQPGNFIKLRSSTDGFKWQISFPGGPQTVSFGDVKDSDALLNTVACPDSLDSGNNNANWLFTDSTPPGGATDLAAAALAVAGVRLSWTAPGDDGTSGVLNYSTYTIQYATSTGIDWSTSAAQIHISTTGVNPGASQSYTLGGLSGNTSYYFRLWTKDDSGNYSALSNGATALTLIDTPTAIYFDEISTGSITASAYVPTPAFSGLDVGFSGVNISTASLYPAWRTGNKWETKLMMNTARQNLAAVVVNGKIYAIGGSAPGAVAVNEEYNTVSNTWATKAAMPAARDGLAAAVVNGKIYAMGGGASAKTNEEYDPAANTWSTKAGMITGRTTLAAAAINGKIYAMGGAGPLSANEEYDPATNSWTVRAPMPNGRYSLAVAAVNGRVYAIGGEYQSQQNEEYDPVADAWAMKSDLPTPRSNLAAAVLGGKIYVIGGIYGTQMENEEYDPAADAWASRAPMSSPRYNLAAAAAGGRIYALGGYNDSLYLSTNQEYDPGTASKFTGLKPNTEYFFKSKARNSVGVETPESPVFSTYTLAAVGAPVGITTFTPVYASSLTVNWSSGAALGGYNGAGAGYLVEAAVSSITFAPVIASSLTYNISAGLVGLTPTVTYYFRVKAANNLGAWGDYMVLGSTVMKGFMGTPTGIYFDSISTYSITAAAYAPTPAFSGLEIVSSGINIAKDGVYAGWWSGNKWVTKTGTGVMPTARYGLASAAVNGRLYAIGGVGAVSMLNTNEEYNPVANTWATPSKTVMPTGRQFPVAAAVGGRIYVIGGAGGAGTLNTNEEYNPVTNTWATKAPMPTARYAQGMAVVSDRIYAVGGYAGTPITANEEYDPVADTWKIKIPMPTARYYLGAAAVNGRIYAIGGETTIALNTNEEYDPAVNVWTSKRPMPSARYGLGVAALGGKVYAMGGFIAASTGVTQEYDPAVDVWATRANMNAARYWFQAVTVSSRIYAVGGYTTMYVNTNEEYDPGTAYSFTGLAPNTQYAFKAKARDSLGVETAESPEISTYTLAAVAGAQTVSTFTAVYVSSLTVNWSSGTPAGGYNGPGAQYLVEASVSSTTFSPVSASSLTYNTWAGLRDIAGNNTTYYFRVRPMNNIGVWGNYLVLGSTYVTGVVEAPTAVYFDEVSTGAITAAAYAPAPAFTNLNLGLSGIDIAKDGAYAGWRSGNVWVTRTAMLATRYGHAAAAVNGRIYAVGGVTSLTLNQEYDPVANSWTNKAPMPTGRQYLAVAAAGGRVYAIGGSGGLNVNQEYDPVANTWLTRAIMPTARSALAAAAAGGRIYAIGGYTTAAVATNEEYNPVSGTWATRTDMPTARYYHAAAASGGKIYATGGVGPLAANEEYDPASNSWVTKSVMPTARFYHAAAAAGGKIYAIGGSGPLTTNEEFDPAVNIWTPRPKMTNGRHSLAAVAAGGRIYAIGGYTTGAVNTNEEYDPGTAFKFTGLLPNTLYSFKARARNASGIETAESAEFSTYTLAAVGAAQGGPGFTAVYASSLTVNWSSGSALGGYNAPGARYQVEASVSSATFSPVIASSVTYNLWAGLQGFTGNATYYFRAKAANNLGVWGDYQFIGSTVAGAIETPAGVYFDEIFAGSITASAYAPTPAFTNLNIGVSGANVARDGVYGGWRGADAWTGRTGMATARYGHAAAAVNGRIYVIGGSPAGNDEYDPVANTWASKAAMISARNYLAAAAVSGKVYAIGGTSVAQNENEEYDPVANKWQTKAAMPTGRYQLAAAAVDGRLYALGGVGGTNVNQEYDPISNTWASKATMITARTFFAVAVVGGKIYAIGGTGGTQKENEEYDPALNAWMSKAAMPAARSQLAAASVGGKIYAIGGLGGTQKENEEYDPAVNVWTSRVNMPTPRYYLAAAAAGGRVYAIGGYSGGAVNTNEQYDPGTAHIFSGLIPNTQYFFKAKARNAYGYETPESVEISTYTLAAIAKAAGPTFVEVSSSGAGVNWSSGTAAGGYNGPGASYKVQVSTSASFSGVVISSYPVYASSVTLYSLLGNSTYYFRAQAYNVNGVTDGSWLVLGTTPTLSAQVSGIQVAGVHVTSITVSWTALPPSPQSDTCEGYILQASTAADFTGLIYSTSTLSVGASALTLRRLSTETTYYLRAGTLNWSGLANYVSAGSTATLPGIYWIGADGGDWHTPSNWSSNHVPLFDETVIIDETLSVMSYSSNPAAAFSSLQLGNAAGTTSPVLRLSTGTAWDGGDLVLYAGATLLQNTTQQLRLASLTMAPGALITHAAASVGAESAAVNIYVAGDVDLVAGSAINADGKGYAGGASGANGYGPGAGTGQAGGDGSGGGYGGSGGDSKIGGLSGGVTYGVLTDPPEPGSGGGGGGFAGGAGGGSIRLEVAGTLNIAGTISANGNNGEGSGPDTNGGAGSGGGIRFIAGNLAGSGLVRANGGGTAGGSGGGGGGGRIRGASRLSNGTLQASGGTGFTVGVTPYIDCGYRIFDGAAVQVIACEPAGTLTSSMRTRKALGTYGILLVPVSDPEASKQRVQTLSGTRSLRKF